MSKTHFIPQFYLRKFASKRPTKSKSEIFILDKWQKRKDCIEEKLIKDIACIDDFYPDWLDKIFTDKEDKWSKTLDIVLSKLSQKLRIDDSLKSEFAEIMAYQFLRTEKLSDSYMERSKENPIIHLDIRKEIEKKYGIPCDEVLGREAWSKSFVDPDYNTIVIFVNYLALQ